MFGSRIPTRHFALFLVLFISGRAAGQGTVAGSGSVEIKRPPEALRVQVDLLARGKDVKEALAKLKERREAAVAQLTGLGVPKAAVVIGEPTLSSDKTQRQQQIERMMQMRRGGKPARPKAEQPVFVSAPLKADLPLKAVGPEELLVAAHALQEKIKAADLGGLKDVEKPTSPQEEELAEEMGPEFGGDEGPKRGEPVFSFVAAVPDAERAKALADAFQKAKRDATRLARAAGAELGPVRTLSENQQTGGLEEDPLAGPRRFYDMAMVGRPPVPPADDERGEAVGGQPGKVVLRVSVSVQFELKSPAKP
jgi:uncharacterized protein YggE